MPSNPFSCCDSLVWCNECIAKLQAQFAKPENTIIFNRIRPVPPVFLNPAELSQMRVEQDTHDEWRSLNECGMRADAE